MRNLTRKTLHTKSETELAALQVRQQGNTCSFHAIAAAIRLLLDYHIDPIALSGEINRLWWRGRFMRVIPNWAVTPRMQARIVHYLAKKHHLPLTASYQHGDIDILPWILNDPDAVPLVTLLWSRRSVPPIYLGSTSQNQNSLNKLAGHTMILAAYDPQHQADHQFSTPWGFINPWRNNINELYWMRDEDFRKAWRSPLPLIGPNPLVIIRKHINFPEILI
ncbi:MAG: hypothetical protein P1P73_02195 [Brevefilum sp.]|nr:hypothetical protein [Brevefilum sp.]